jgi:hypothetical protein
MPTNVLGGGSVRSRSGTRYVLGLLEKGSEEAFRSFQELSGAFRSLSTYKIRANLFRRKRKSKTWTANTIMATANAVRKLTIPIP